MYTKAFIKGNKNCRNIYLRVQAAEEYLWGSSPAITGVEPAGVASHRSRPVPLRQQPDFVGGEESVESAFCETDDCDGLQS